MDETLEVLALVELAGLDLLARLLAGGELDVAADVLEVSALVELLRDDELAVELVFELSFELAWVLAGLELDWTEEGLELLD